MQAPVDYPINDAARNAQFSMDELMYATLLDRMPSSEPLALESHYQVPHPIDVIHDEPTACESIPQPLAAIAQTLLAGERANMAAGVLSRWTRTHR